MPKSESCSPKVNRSVKVLGSETIQYCSDEGIQIYGGMGYSADVPMIYYSVFSDMLLIFFWYSSDIFEYSF